MAAANQAGRDNRKDANRLNSTYEAFALKADCLSYRESTPTT
jgi:hypothetical protein